MKKKSTSRSAFLNLRILIGLNISLVGVVLALLAAASPSLRGSDPVTSVTPHRFSVMPVSGAHILFNQLTGTTWGFVPAQRFVPPSPIDADGVDDFMVFDAKGWTITQFNFDIFVVESEPLVDIRVYPDNNGQPGEPAVCSYNGINAKVHGSVPIGSVVNRLRVPLPTPCVLDQGRYWVSLTRSDSSEMRWAAGTPDPFPPPFVLGAHARWRNPGDGYGSGCTDWSDITTCFVDGKPVGGEEGEQFKFQICGAIGADGTVIGCGDENAQSGLAVTLAVDNGDPEQCGTATTLDVEAGSRINVCYTITNAGNAPLGFHWLRDNLDTRRLFRGTSFPALLHGESFHFNRLITATTSQTIAAESQATDVPPWYFSAEQGFAFIDIASAGTSLNLDDDGSANVMMPFRFNLYGVESDQLCINNNGFVLLDWSKPCNGFHEDASIPNENVPLGSAQIAPFWDDLFTGGNVYYAVVGQAPKRKFIVQWDHKNHYNNGVSDPGGITFEMILEETTNTISFQYLNTSFNNSQHPEWDRGGSATVGFQSYVRDSLFGSWVSLPFHQPAVNPGSGLTRHPQDFFHTTASGVATLNVNAPAIGISPEALQATVAQGGSTSAPLTLSNSGTRNLQWQMGESPLGSRSHFPTTFVPLVADLNLESSVRSLAAVPPQKSRINHPQAGPGQPNSFATRAFAVRYEFSVAPFPTLYTRLNDITNPADTQDIRDLVARDIFASAFIGQDFSQQFAIDDCCSNFLTIDTTTGEPSINLGTVRHNPSQLARWWGMTWDSTTDNVYVVASNTFDILSNTRFFLVRIDRGHEIVATTIGELPGIAQGVAMFGIAVDSIGRMFGVDVLGDRLFAIDKQNADAAAIGPLGFNANGALGLDFDDLTGALYLASLDNNSGISNLYTVNTSTGLATSHGQLGNGSQHAALAIASGAPCVPPTEVPWLSLNPASGNIAPGGNNTIAALMNASTLPTGTQHAEVCVGSNDPVHPLVAVPVTLQVTVPVGSVVSRKTHGSAGTFNVDLPLTGTPGVECRTGGATNDYTIVIEFGTNVAVTGSPQAQITSGAATVGSNGISNGGTVAVNGNVVTIPITNFANAQTINVRLNGVNGSFNLDVPMSLLIGDTNGNHVVNATDISQTKSRVGQVIDTANFRSDLNVSAAINSSDISIVKSKAGTALP